MTAETGTTLDGHAVVEVRLLGPLRMHLAGRDVTARLRPDMKRLLVALLLKRPGIHQRDHLAYTLWPDVAEGVARQRLRTALHILAKLVEPVVPLTALIALDGRRGLGWRDDAPAWIDLDALEEALARWSAAPSPDAAAGPLAALVVLCAGPLAADADFDAPWLEVERQRVADRMSAPLRACIHAHARRDDAEEALRAADALERFRPDDDGAALLVLRTRYAYGQGTHERSEATRPTKRGGDGGPPSPAVERWRAWMATALPPDGTTASTAGAGATSVRSPSSLSPPPLWPPLVGRAAEVAAVLDLLCGQRLVTVTGPAGIGKSRLLAEAVRLVAPRFEAVYPVPLAEASGPAEVLRTIAQAVDLPTAAPPSLRAIVAHLGGAHCLLVLDDTDPEVETVATVVRELIRLCPDVTVLASGRERLVLDGEAVVTLDPLAAVGGLEDPARAIYVHSYAHEAGVQPPTATIKSAERSTLPALDGWPLAVELAGRAMAHRIDVAGTGTDDTLFEWRCALPFSHQSRHRCLADAFGWTLERLSDDERAVLGATAGDSADRVGTAADREAVRSALGALRWANAVRRLAAKSWIIPRGGEAGGMAGAPSVPSVLDLARRYLARLR